VGETLGEKFCKIAFFSTDMSSALSTFKVDLLLQAAEVVDRNDIAGSAHCTVIATLDSIFSFWALVQCGDADVQTYG